MASGSRRNDAGVDGPIYEWTSFKEAEGRIASYVFQVFSKTCNRYHKSAGDALIDYETCIKLLINLMDESSRLTIDVYVVEYLYNHAVQIKDEMLRSFSTMFPHLLLESVFSLLGLWLEEEKKAAPKDLLSDSEHSINCLDENVEVMDDDLKNAINKQKKRNFQCLRILQLHFNRILEEFKLDPNAMMIGNVHHKEKCLDRLVKMMNVDLQIPVQKEGYLQYLQNLEVDLSQFLADAIKEEFKLDPNAMMDENLHMKIEMVKQTENFLLRLNIPYQGVKYILSHADVELASVTALVHFCKSTLMTLKETISMLSADFYKLVQTSEDEENLLNKWSNLTRDMDQHPLVQREKEEYENARDDSDE